MDLLQLQSHELLLLLRGHIYWSSKYCNVVRLHHCTLLFIEVSGLLSQTGTGKSHISDIGGVGRCKNWGLSPWIAVACEPNQCLILQQILTSTVHITPTPLSVSTRLSFRSLGSCCCLGYLAPTLWLLLQWFPHFPPCLPTSQKWQVYARGIISINQSIDW